ncbi:MAG: hypothetical protein U1A24_16400 [Cypionkella sp.]|uniref:hypothetical protein n=1 Tax=Cypionkella sp. TaxID=2811411 RepID=UPI002ABA0A64|nr:hypothetical protein [Cypionkella sp.]MDZ4312130.1 hypothetical protein [Cypionkella sp.]
MKYIAMEQVLLLARVLIVVLATPQEIYVLSMQTLEKIATLVTLGSKRPSAMWDEAVT